MTTRRSLIGRDPLLLSDSLGHLGDVLTRQAQFDAAETVYREAIRVDSSRPKDRRSRARLASSLYGSVCCSHGRGSTPMRRRHLREALARQQAIYGAGQSGRRPHAQGPGAGDRRRRRH